MVKSKWILVVAFAAISLSGVATFANEWGKGQFDQFDQFPRREDNRRNGFEGCDWVVRTADRIVTAECRGGDFVVSGGCKLDQGSFRQGFPDGISNGSNVRRGDGWICETTANQPITAAALCCPRD